MCEEKRSYLFFEWNDSEWEGGGTSERAADRVGLDRMRNRFWPDLRGGFLEVCSKHHKLTVKFQLYVLGSDSQVSGL